MNSGIIEGNISAGKSTLSKEIGDKYGIKIMDEFVNDKLLALFYGDKIKYGFAFQLYMQSTRLFQVESIKYLNTNCILDRGIYGDMVFAYLTYLNGNISNKEFDAYMSIMKDRIAILEKLPKWILYLNVSPEECYKRVLTRNRQSETSVDFDYLNQVYQIYFHTMIRLDHDFKVIIYDWENYGNVDDVYNTILNVNYGFSGKASINLSNHRIDTNWKLNDFPIGCKKWYPVDNLIISEIYTLMRNGIDVSIEY